MTRTTEGISCILSAAMLATSAIAAEPIASLDRDGVVGASQGSKTILGWRKSLLTQPTGGAKFAASAFFHPLCTPSGFECTTIQPSDHLHHFGLWWPWKFVEVDGKRYNTWEIQEGQGGHVAKSAKALPATAGVVAWELENETIIKPAGAEPRPAIQETTMFRLTDESPDTRVLDIDIRQKAAGAPVTIVGYRYSGFSWRGPSSWNKDNSIMTTSGNKGRDNANSTPARWVLVSGPTPTGKASLLMMSAAAEIAESEEKVRVWDSKAHNGAPFVNFNPVMQNPLPLDESQPAVSHRRYRIIAADREMDAAAAEAAWRKWLGK